MSELDKLAKLYGTDKSSEIHNYCVKYEKYLPFNREEKLKILEIGVLNGQSLKTWRDFYVNASIIGIDINPNCKQYEGDRITIEIGSQIDKEFLNKISEQHGPFDMILDDGSHMNDHVIFSFENLLKSLKPGGIYVVEDSSTSYWEEFGGGMHKEGASIEYFKKMVDEVNFFGERGERISNARREDYLLEQFNRKGYHYIGTQFESINFLNSIIIITKSGGHRGPREIQKTNLSKYNIDNTSQFPPEKFKDHVFVIDNWPDTESKENDLINLIKMLKIYNIPIILAGHYPLKPEIQKMGDYYLFDKNNDILSKKDFEKYNVNSGRWTKYGGMRLDNVYEFHHDYAIWETMRNSFNFCDFLGKKYIHFLEYDNLPDPIQFRQAFMEYIPNYDAVLYEYHKGSIKDSHFGAYCATFIFSIKTETALKVINGIKNKDEYFTNRPKGWQLERVFLDELNKVTKSIYISKYIDNDNKLNTQAVWNRDGINRGGSKIQFYLGVDNTNDLYLHIISGFHEKDADMDYLVEVEYMEYKKFHRILKKQMYFEKIGEYKKGEVVKVFHQGVEIYKEFLEQDIDDFRRSNKLTHENDKKVNEMYTPKEVSINFIDGPFVEILDDIEKEYVVEFVDLKETKSIHKTNLKSNHWTKPNLKYHRDWLVTIDGVDNDYHYEHEYSVYGRKVLISFESKALGDTLAWIPQVERFSLETKSKVVCSTFHNKILKDQYPNIEFVNPGSHVTDIYSLFRIGVFKDANGHIEYDKHPIDPKKLPLGKICSDILGVDYVEVKAKLPVYTTEKKKVISIATHGTAQCKYWNNPTGWQEVVDYLVLKGYEVKLLSKEDSGYMGNKNPKNVTKVRSGSIENIMKIIQESELFIGISSGLSWVSWACGTDTILISGFTDEYTEPSNGIRRIINKNVCNSCWNKYEFDPGDWNWCPEHKGTDKQFECTKEITSQTVIDQINLLLGF